MRKKGANIRLFLFAVLVILAGCDKSVVDTKKLTKKGRWMVTQIEIGSNLNSALPVLDFQDSEDPNEFSVGTWIHEDNSEAIFKWRFNYFEGTFSLIWDEPFYEGEPSKAQLQCSNLSGHYEIITDKSKLFEFSSETTKQYPGVRVFIQMVPL